MLSLLLGLLSLLFWHKSVFQLDLLPFTLQNFAIGLIATVFRPREAVLSVGLYLLLGAIGLPVFAGRWSWISCFGWSYCRLSLVLSRLLWTYFFSNQQQEWCCQDFSCKPLGIPLVFVGGIIGLHFLAGMPFEKTLLWGYFPLLSQILVKLLLLVLLAVHYFNALKIKLTLLN